jgi:endonuclease G
MISPADLFFKGPLVVEEAFYMSTVTPQSPWLNRNLWSDVETRVRKAVQSSQRVAFVIAGPLFLGAGSEVNTIGAGRIPVPTHFFRVMARQAESGLDAFGLIAPNVDQGVRDIDRYLVSIREIEQKSGLTLFPLLPSHTGGTIRNEVRQAW